MTTLRHLITVCNQMHCLNFRLAEQKARYLRAPNERLAREIKSTELTLESLCDHETRRLLIED